MDTTSSNRNIFLLEVMSGLEKALIALRILPMETPARSRRLSLRNGPKFSPVESNENIHRL